ncbi:MAG: recombinase family protein [Patescibacteria group bacterium]
MTALIYLRVSTDRQAEKQLSIPTQREECFKFAYENGYHVSPEKDVYADEGESARTTKRPQFQMLLERCRTDKNVKAVVCYDISRFARNRMDFAITKMELEQNDIKICSATEGIDDTPGGQMLEGVLSTVAEFFSRQSGSKVKAGLLQKARGGQWPGQAPYGYKNVQERLSVHKARTWLEVNWEEAKWVIRAFELYASGSYSIKSLTATLQEEGFKVRSNRNEKGKLHASHVEKILRNKLYVGIIEWSGFVNPEGTHELFLNQHVFDKVQALLDVRSSGGARHRRLFSVLKGVSWCGVCGSRQTLEEHKTSSKRVILYLRCMKAQKNERVACSQSFVHESDISTELEGIIKKIHLPDEVTTKIKARVRDLFANEQATYENARKDITKKIDNIKLQKKNLVLQLIGQDHMLPSDIELYDKIKVELGLEETRLLEELGKVENRIRTAIRTIEIATSLATDCHYTYKKAQPELKNMLVQTFFKRIEIKDKKIARVVLNEPLDYLCAPRLRKHPVFDLGAFNGR